MNRNGAETGAITTLYDSSGIALKTHIVGHMVKKMHPASPFLLRTVQPTLEELEALKRH